MYRMFYFILFISTSCSSSDILNYFVSNHKNIYNSINSINIYKVSDYDFLLVDENNKSSFDLLSSRLEASVRNFFLYGGHINACKTFANNIFLQYEDDVESIIEGSILNRNICMSSKVLENFNFFMLIGEYIVLRKYIDRNDFRLINHINILQNNNLLDILDKISISKDNSSSKKIERYFEIFNDSLSSSKQNLIDELDKIKDINNRYVCAKIHYLRDAFDRYTFEEYIEKIYPFRRLCRCSPGRLVSKQGVIDDADKFVILNIFEKEKSIILKNLQEYRENKTISDVTTRHEAEEQLNAELEDLVEEKDIIVDSTDNLLLIISNDQNIINSLTNSESSLINKVNDTNIITNDKDININTNINDSNIITNDKDININTNDKDTNIITNDNDTNINTNINDTKKSYSISDNSSVSNSYNVNDTDLEGGSINESYSSDNLMQEQIFLFDDKQEENNFSINEIKSEKSSSDDGYGGSNDSKTRGLSYNEGSFSSNSESKKSVSSCSSNMEIVEIEDFIFTSDDEKESISSGGLLSDVESENEYTKDNFNNNMSIKKSIDDEKESISSGGLLSDVESENEYTKDNFNNNMPIKKLNKEMLSGDRSDDLANKRILSRNKSNDEILSSEEMLSEEEMLSSKEMLSGCSSKISSSHDSSLEKDEIFDYCSLVTKKFHKLSPIQQKNLSELFYDELKDFTDLEETVTKLENTIDNIENLVSENELVLSPFNSTVKVGDIYCKNNQKDDSEPEMEPTNNSKELIDSKVILDNSNERSISKEYIDFKELLGKSTNSNEPSNSKDILEKSNNSNEILETSNNSKETTNSRDLLEKSNNSNEIFRNVNDSKESTHSKNILETPNNSNEPTNSKELLKKVNVNLFDMENTNKFDTVKIRNVKLLEYNTEEINYKNNPVNLIPKDLLSQPTENENKKNDKLKDLCIDNIEFTSIKETESIDESSILNEKPKTPEVNVDKLFIKTKEDSSVDENVRTQFPDLLINTDNNSFEKLNDKNVEVDENKLHFNANKDNINEDVEDQQISKDTKDLFVSENIKDLFVNDNSFVSEQLHKNDLSINEDVVNQLLINENINDPSINRGIKDPSPVNENIEDQQKSMNLSPVNEDKIDPSPENENIKDPSPVNEYVGDQLPVNGGIKDPSPVNGGIKCTSTKSFNLEKDIPFSTKKIVKINNKEIEIVKGPNGNINKSNTVKKDPISFRNQEMYSSLGDFSRNDILKRKKGSCISLTSSQHSLNGFKKEYTFEEKINNLSKPKDYEKIRQKVLDKIEAEEKKKNNENNKKKKNKKRK